MSSPILGKAILELVTDGTALEKGLDSAQAKATGWSQNVSGVAKGAALAIAGVGAAAGAIIGTMVASAQAVANQAGEVAQLKRETGLTTEEVSKLRYEGERFNISTDDMSKSLGILSKSLESAHPSLEKYDIEVVKTKDGHIDMEATLGKVADRFKAMPDGVEKTALSLAIFGKSGKEMIPLLNQGSDGLKAMGIEAANLGLVFDDKTLAAAKRLNLAHKDLDDRLEGLRNRIGIAFLPVLADWTGSLVNVADAVLPSISSGLQTFTTIVGAVLKPIGELKDILSGALAPEAWSINRLIGEDRGAQVIGVLQTVKRGISEIPGLIGQVAGSIGEIFDVATGRRPEAGGMLRSLVGDEKATDIMSTVGRVRDALTEAFDFVKPILQAAIDKVVELRGEFDKLPPAIKGFAAAAVVGQASGFNDWLLGAASNVAQVAQGLVGAVAGFPGFIAGIKGVVLAVPEYIAGMGSAALAGWAVIAPFLPFIALGLLIGIAIGLLITHWDDFSQSVVLVGKIIGAVLGKIGDAIGDFLGFWIGVWDEISSKPGHYLGLALGFIIGTLLNIAQAIGDFAGAAVKTVIKWLGDSKTNIWDFFGALPGAIANWLGNVVVAVVSFGIDALKAVALWIIDTDQTITTFFTGLPAAFWDFAVKAVQGLAGGFGSMVGWIRDQIFGFFSGIVDGVKAALGIHSPSTVFMRVGEEIVNGLTLGFNNTSPAALAAVKGLLGDISAVSKQITEAMTFNTKFGREVVQPGTEGLGSVSSDQSIIGHAGAIPIFGPSQQTINLNVDGKTLASVITDRFTSQGILAGGSPA